MNIQEIEIDKVIPYHNNPRKDQAVDKVASSINEYGFQQPIQHGHASSHDVPATNADADVPAANG